VTNEDLARTYIAAFAARDYDQVSALLTDDFRLRDLSPGGFTQVDGADEAMAGLQAFLDGFASVELEEVEAYDVADVTYLRARVRFVHPSAGERFLEQHHLLRIRDGRISGVDELCTGLHVP
jgi:ketosteroid isomerase-like protein